MAANRSNWDERVPVHLTAYDADAFAADPEAISTVVREDMALVARHLPGGSPAGLDLVHLMCHIGTDTLSWARLGAAVTGVDFSPAAVAAATDLATRTGLPAAFVEADVCATSAVVGAVDGARFDVAVMSVGVLPWVSNLQTWAATVAALLRPGGLFFLRDAHPLLGAVDYDDPVTTDGRPVLSGAYLATGAPRRYEHGTTYADDSVQLSNATTYEWQHSVGDVVQALLDAGLRLTSLAEHTTISWPVLPHLVRTEDGFALPEHRERLPLALSLTAIAPQAQQDRHVWQDQRTQAPCRGGQGATGRQAAH